jgi:hypothetical protein
MKYANVILKATRYVLREGRLSLKKAILLATIVLCSELLTDCVSASKEAITSRHEALVEITITYTGTWYRETFGYTTRARNIRHYVLLMPEKYSEMTSAGLIFTSIRFPATKDVLLMKDDRKRFSWALEYIYEAPKGIFRDYITPGTYYVAVCFIAAPLTSADIGYPEDKAILFPGIDGGGASNDYEKVVFEAGQEYHLEFELTDGNGWG